MNGTAKERLSRLLDRPGYLPRSTREEIVGAAIAKLHEDLAPYRKPAGHAALEEQP